MRIISKRRQIEKTKKEKLQSKGNLVFFRSIVVFIGDKFEKFKIETRLMLF